MVGQVGGHKDKDKDKVDDHNWEPHDDDDTPDDDDEEEEEDKEHDKDQENTTYDVDSDDNEGLIKTQEYAVVMSFIQMFNNHNFLPSDVGINDIINMIQDHDQIDPKLQDLHIKLLRRAIKSFHIQKWERHLVKFCVQNNLQQAAWELERFGYKKSNPMIKLTILKSLLEHQFVCDAKFKVTVNNIEPKDLRLQPIGRDANGKCYWLQMDHRANITLYQEDQDEETFHLLASDREGVKNVIAALKSGKPLIEPTPEIVLNEDSNSLENTLPQTDDDKSDSKNEESKEELNIIATKSKKKSSDTVDCRPSKRKKKGRPSKKHHEEDDVIEEKVMIVRGEGSGADCDAVPEPFFSDEICEDVFYVCGEGSGFDCDMGNPTPPLESTSDQKIDGEDLRPEGNTLSSDCISDQTITGKCNVLNEDEQRKINGAENSKNVIPLIVSSDDKPAASDSQMDLKNTSAPLPVTKRFLQNIPKTNSVISDNTKSNLQTVDSDSNKSSESLENISTNASDNVDSTVLVNSVDKENQTVISSVNETSELSKKSETIDDNNVSDPKNIMENTEKLSKSEEELPVTKKPMFFFGHPGCLKLSPVLKSFSTSENFESKDTPAQNKECLDNKNDESSSADLVTKDPSIEKKDLEEVENQPHSDICQTALTKEENSSLDVPKCDDSLLGDEKSDKLLLTNENDKSLDLVSSENILQTSDTHLTETVLSNVEEIVSIEKFISINKDSHEPTLANKSLDQVGQQDKLVEDSCPVEKITSEEGLVGTESKSIVAKQQKPDENMENQEYQKELMIDDKLDECETISKDLTTEKNVSNSPDSCNLQKSQSNTDSENLNSEVLELVPEPKPVISSVDSSNTIDIQVPEKQLNSEMCLKECDTIQSKTNDAATKNIDDKSTDCLENNTKTTISDTSSTPKDSQTTDNTSDAISESSLPEKYKTSIQTETQTENIIISTLDIKEDTNCLSVKEQDTPTNLSNTKNTLIEKDTQNEKVMNVHESKCDQDSNVAENDHVDDLEMNQNIKSEETERLYSKEVADNQLAEQETDDTITRHINETPIERLNDEHIENEKTRENINTKIDVDLTENKKDVDSAQIQNDKEEIDTNQIQDEEKTELHANLIDSNQVDGKLEVKQALTDMKKEQKTKVINADPIDDEKDEQNDKTVISDPIVAENKEKKIKEVNTDIAVIEKSEEKTLNEVDSDKTVSEGTTHQTVKENKVEQATKKIYADLTKKPEDQDAIPVGTPKIIDEKDYKDAEKECDVTQKSNNSVLRKNEEKLDVDKNEISILNKVSDVHCHTIKEPKDSNQLEIEKDDKQYESNDVDIIDNKNNEKSKEGKLSDVKNSGKHKVSESSVDKSEPDLSESSESCLTKKPKLSTVDEPKQSLPTTPTKGRRGRKKKSVTENQITSSPEVTSGENLPQQKSKSEKDKSTISKIVSKLNENVDEEKLKIIEKMSTQVCNVVVSKPKNIDVALKNTQETSDDHLDSEDHGNEPVSKVPKTKKNVKCVETPSKTTRPTRSTRSQATKEDEDTSPLEDKSVNRKRAHVETESPSEEEYKESQKVKKLKLKPKISHSVRKKVEIEKQYSTSEDEQEAINAKTTATKGKKKSITKKAETPDVLTESPKKETVKTKKEKAKRSKSPAVVIEEPPVRQSRRIAQLKIREEAERRLLEEMALRELKAKHTKNLKPDKDKDWEHSSSDHSSDGKKLKKKKNKDKKMMEKFKKNMTVWHTTSGTESDTEAEEDIDDHEEEEEEELVFKSDHEFSPESDIEEQEVVPARRARTLQKDNDTGCTSCKKNDHPEWILLCDSCDDGWHASCLKPVLFLIPEGEWFCPPCNHKRLIAALESKLEEHHRLLDKVRIEDDNRRELAEKKLEEEEDESEDDKSSKSQVVSSDLSGSDTSSTDSDDEKIYRLRERRQLPISYHLKQYDQLMSSGIKEEIKDEDDESPTGNQGRGKDISTIIEANREEKKAALQAALQAKNEGCDEVKEETLAELIENKKRATIKSRRKPRKLNSLDVMSDDCDDNSDEDFKEASNTSTSEETASESDQTEELGDEESSHSSDSMPLRRSLRAPKRTKKKSDGSPSRHKKKKKISDDDSEESSPGAKEWDAMEEKLADSPKKKNKKSKKHKKRKNADTIIAEGEEKDEDSSKANVHGKAKIKYGGLSDSSKSSHDWSPAHRTRQRKYNYMELPNTDSEDEAHKPSGKHMYSSDEYKENSSDFDSDASKRRKKKLLKTPESPKPDAVKQDDENVQKPPNAEGENTDAIGAIPTTPVKGKGSRGRGCRGRPRGSRGTPRGAGRGRGGRTSTTPGGEGENGEGNDFVDKKAAKLEEKEKKKEERLKKKEEKLQQKEQKAKEREEKKQARMSIKEQRPSFPMNPQGFGPQPGMPMNLGPPGHFQQFPPGMHPRGYPPHPNMMRPPYPMDPRFANSPFHSINRQLNEDPSVKRPEPRPGPQPGSFHDQPINYRQSEPLPLQMGSREGSPGEDPERKNFPYGSANIAGHPYAPNQLRPSLPSDHPRMVAMMRAQGPHFMQNVPNRPLPPGYVLDNRGMPVPMDQRPPVAKREEVHSPVQPQPESQNVNVPSNLTSRVPESASQINSSDSFSGNESSASLPSKRRGRGLGKKTLAKQAAAAATGSGASNPGSDGNISSPGSSSSIPEGTLAVAGAPQPFRPTCDPPSVITRMPHMMPPPYGASSIYGNPPHVYGPPRGPPPVHMGMGGMYRPHHPHPLDPSPSGGGPISMTNSPGRVSPQSQPYGSYPSSPYYPPGSSYPPPHGRYPGPPPAQSRSPAPRIPTDVAESSDKSNSSDKLSSTPPIKSEIKEEPVKQPASPTGSEDKSPKNDDQGSSSNEESSQPSTQPPVSKPSHPQMKHVEGKSERARGRIAVTAASRYPQGPYAPQYGPYAPYPPTTESMYLQHQQHGLPPQAQSPHHPMMRPQHHSLQPQQHGLQPQHPHQPLPPHQNSPHPSMRQPSPLQLLSQQMPPHSSPNHSRNSPHPPPPSRYHYPLHPQMQQMQQHMLRHPMPPHHFNPHGPRGSEDEPSEFGGLVSYFSSQHDDEHDT